jgi:MYXO-CTERM domain-containing protein
MVVARQVLLVEDRTSAAVSVLVLLGVASWRRRLSARGDW